MSTRVLVAIALLTACSARRGKVVPAVEASHVGIDDGPVGRLTIGDYKALMNQLADAWNTNDARRAVELFSDHAVYSAPPEGKVRRGRDELFRFFGGPSGRPRPMRMDWHHLVFDEKSQIGAGEYTFTYEIRTHGAVMVRIVNGKIANWREHEQASPLDWEEFMGPNRF